MPSLAPPKVDNANRLTRACSRVARPSLSLLRRFGSFVFAGALLVACKAEEKDKPIPLPSGRAPDSSGVVSALAVSAGPVLGRCEMRSEVENYCLEFQDAEIEAEWKSLCGGVFGEGRCSMEGAVGACRLPDGTVRVGYPPRPSSYFERACRESQGQWHAGSTLSTTHTVVVASCSGKYEEACEEEEIHSTSRLAPAEDECKSFGGSFQKGRACPRETLLSECDLPGKKRLLMTGPANPEARGRFCTQKKGKLINRAPEPAPSASVAPDLDPPPEKGEVEVHH